MRLFQAQRQFQQIHMLTVEPTNGAADMHIAHRALDDS